MSPDGEADEKTEHDDGGVVALDTEENGESEVGDNPDGPVFQILAPEHVLGEEGRKGRKGVEKGQKTGGSPGKKESEKEGSDQEDGYDAGG